YDATLSLRYPDFSHWSDGTTGDKVITWTIGPRQISASDFAAIDDVVYSGEQIEPVLVPIGPLTSDDFTFTYGNNKDVGTGTIDVTAKNNFFGDITLEFDIIKKKNLKVIVHDANSTYGGAAPAYDYHFEGFVEGEDASVLGGTLSIVCDYPGINGDAGEYPIVASGLTSDNYDIEYVNGKFIVSPYQLRADDFDIDLSDEMYDGTEHLKDVDAKPVFIDESSDIIVEHRNNIDASTPDGKAQIVINGDGRNCVGTVTKEFTITKRDVKFTSPSESYVYDGQPHTFDADDITISGTGLVEGHDVTFSDFISETVVGSYTNSFSYAFVPAAVADNYSVTTEFGELTITAVVEPIVVTADSASKRYDGTPLTDDGFTYTGSLVRGDGIVVVVEGTITDYGTTDNVVTSVKVMRGDVEVTGSYTFGTHVKGTLEVTKRSVTLTSESASKFYDGTPLTDHNVIVGGDGFVDGDGATYSFRTTSTVTFVKDSPVDNEFTYVLKDGTNASNYDISVDFGTLTIDKVPSTLTIMSGSTSKVYDGTPLTFHEYSKSSSVLIAGDVLTVTFSGTVTDVTVDPVDNAFTYVIKRGDVDVTYCYTVDAVFGELKVTPYTIVPNDFTVDLEDEVYNGYPQTKVIIPNRTFLRQDVTYSVTYADNTTPGVAKVIITGKSPNCTGTVTYEFEIKGIGITITADSADKTYDGSPLTDNGFVRSGELLAGDELTVTVVGSQTDAGSSANKVTGYKV
ncbi:MAG: hypothetical protein IKA33_01300, partial [Candidatus Methanomethylophilaceae archaeon]|nr:hypothetical protein [Candidatus Methanomethylophilaceae archaeon]